MAYGLERRRIRVRAEAGIGQGRNKGHLLIREFKAEYIQILTYAFGMDRFHKGQHAVLYTPAHQQLGRGPAEFASKIFQQRLFQQLTTSKGAPRFNQDGILAAKLKRFCLKQAGMVLNLVYYGSYVGRSQHG